jgi:gluconate kinase
VSVSDSENGVRLSDEQRLDWLRLIRSENIGPRGIMAQTPQERNRPAP